MEVLPSPGVLPTSQEAGNMVHDQSLAMTAPGSQPGFDGGTFAGPWPQNSDNPPAGMPAERPVGNPPPKPQPTSTWRPGGGAWVTDAPDNAGVPAPGGGWTNI
jgi:hypothetical protein